VVRDSEAQRLQVLPDDLAVAARVALQRVVEQQLAEVAMAKASLTSAAAAANTLTMAHIHRLVCQPYVYLSCPDLVADTYSSQTTKPNRGILAKLHRGG
jgi:hypothetical protein